MTIVFYNFKQQRPMSRVEASSMLFQMQKEKDIIRRFKREMSFQKMKRMMAVGIKTPGLGEFFTSFDLAG